MTSESKSLEEIDLLSFFEVEPTRLDGDTPWPYSQLTYRTRVGQYQIHFCFTPSCLDVDLSVSNDDSEIYRFEGLALKDVRYHNDNGVETLQIVISDQDSVWFRIRPSLLITQSITDM